jgi:hypothetical protein
VKRNEQKKREQTGEKEKIISNSMTYAVYLPIEISSSSRSVIAVCS